MSQPSPASEPAAAAEDLGNVSQAMRSVIYASKRKWRDFDYKMHGNDVMNLAEAILHDEIVTKGRLQAHDVTLVDLCVVIVGEIFEGACDGIVGRNRTVECVFFPVHFSGR